MGYGTDDRNQPLLQGFWYNVEIERLDDAVDGGNLGVSGYM